MARTLRIALVYLSRRGGIARYTLELSRVLQSMCDLSCHFSEYNVFRSELERLNAPTRFYPTYMNWVSFAARTIMMKGPRQIAANLIREEPDLVLDTGSGPWGELVSRLTGELRWVRSIHDAVLHENRLRMIQTVQRYLLPLRAEALVGVSEFTAEALRLQFPQVPVIASRHGIMYSESKPETSHIVARRKHFLFFGLIEAYKGLSVLLDAFELAQQRDPAVQLTICGSGPVSNQLLERIQRFGVRFRNEWIPESELDKVFSEIGVVLLPYLTATQSGVAAIALAKGIPMIATDVGALPEQVIDGVNGRVVRAGDAKALADAMLEVAASERLAREFASASLDLGRTCYSWNTIGAELLKELSQLPFMPKPSHSESPAR